MREFDSGATRSDDSYKYDIEGFLSPLALDVYFEYMHSHRVQEDGKLRASDNWQKGISLSQYIKSLLRHTHDLWKIHREYAVFDKKDGHYITSKEAASGILFNTFGYLHELVKSPATEEIEHG